MEEVDIKGIKHVFLKEEDIKSEYQQVYIKEEVPDSSEECLDDYKTDEEFLPVKVEGNKEDLKDTSSFSHWDADQILANFDPAFLNPSLNFRPTADKNPISHDGNEDTIAQSHSSIPEFNFMKNNQDNRPIQSDAHYSDINTYKCEICPYSTARKCLLSGHLRIHTGEKPYKCDICLQSFSLKQYLILHTRTHTGEKPYKCDTCSHAFSRKNGLIQHKRMHTGEKPYKCDTCSKLFSRNQLLIQHKRIHTGEKPYKCEVCSACFSRRRCLIQHLRTHTGEKPYKCNICLKSFSRKDSLVVHNRTHACEKP